MLTNRTPNAQQLTAAIRTAVQSHQPVLPESPEGSSDASKSNEFCLFLKPEITELAEQKFDDVWERVHSALKRFDVRVRMWAVIPGNVLDASFAIRKHYGIIDAISREGASRLAVDASRNLDRYLAEEWSGADVMGAHQFLNRYPYFTPSALAVLYDNLSSVRLAGGSHAALADVRGNPVVVMNGFHPDQLDRYTRQDASIAVFWCESETDWGRLRQDMTGSTNPMKANAGSIRQELFANRASLGLPNFNSSMNGVHLSAGPIEGAIELERYFTLTGIKIDPTRFAISEQFAASGMTSLSWASLERNPATVTQSGDESTVFDLTEELNTKAAVEALRTAKIEI